MIISHNILAINANRQYGLVTRSKEKATEKLSSGYKINRSADDAAGLAISEKMRRQIRGLTQGVANTQDGVSLCQVADGALAEVNDMLNRITELSIKAANGTLVTEDREAIQEEIQQIIKEIDRIGDTTEFNEMPIFSGYDKVLYDVNGNTLAQGNIPFADFVISDVDLGKNPFDAQSGANHLGLQAIVDNADSAANGQVYNLIYGNGSTSNSMIKIDGTVYNLSTLSKENYNYDSASKTWSRDFRFSDSAKNIDLKITQKIGTDTASATEKNYKISYEIEAEPGSRTDVEIGLFLNADTAYNNNDFCEGYFINGNRVNTTGFYKDGSTLMDAESSNWASTSYPSVPDSFSIVDTESALAFSERISFTGGNKPSAMAIGHYSEVKNYDNLVNMNYAGDNTQNYDLGFTLYYEADNINSKQTFSYDYGIVATETDANLQGQTITKNNSPIVQHEDTKAVWIQSGCETGVGMYVTIGEMNASVLGIRGLDVSTVDGAMEAINASKGALHSIMDNRSRIGAQQNRLEHTIANENNVVENATAAESRIRDTDMAKEMVKYSKDNILMQVGQSMLAQANQSGQGVLSLLQ